MKEPLDQFIDRIVMEKGLLNLDPDVLTQVKNDLAERVEDRLNARMMASLPPEKLPEFEKMLDSSSDEEIQKFVSDNIPDLEEVMASELVEFRKTYLGI